MAEISKFSPPQNSPLQPISGGDQVLAAASLCSNPQKHNLPSSPILSPLSMDQNPQISSSPRLPKSQSQQPPPPSQQHQLHQIRQQMQEEQHMQRAGSAMMPKIRQIQKPFGAAAAAMRQQTGLYNGQMNFAGAQLQHLQPQLSSGIMSQGSGGQLSMLSNQALAAAAAQFSMQSQMLGLSSQKLGIVQGSQFLPANSSGQALPVIQTVSTTSSLPLNSQIRMPDPYFIPQRLNQGQIRQQQMSQQLISSSQKIPGQGTTRTSSLASMNPQLSGITPNGQATMMPNSLSQQQWLKQLMTMTVPGSSSYQLQQKALIQLQMHKSMGLTPQHVSQLIQQHQSHISSQQQHNLQVQQSSLLQQQQHLMLQQQQPQQSQRMRGPASQKSMSLTGSQPDSPASDTTTPKGSSSQGTERRYQLIRKRKIHDLVMQVSPLGSVDPEVESLLLEIADDFIDSVTTYACSLSKHRKSPLLESKDLLLHLEKNWQLSIPGYTRGDQRFKRKPVVGDIHKKRIELIRSMMESSVSFQSELDLSKSTARHTAQDQTIRHTIKPSSGSEQLNAPPAGAAMLEGIP